MKVTKLRGDTAEELDGTPIGRIVGVAVYIGRLGVGLGCCTKLPPRRVKGWQRYFWARQFSYGTLYYDSPPQGQIRLLWAMAGLAWKVK